MIDGIAKSDLVILSRRPTFAKRGFDFLFSLLAVIALVPLSLVIAAAIFVDSPGNPIFVQERMGFNGKLFRMLKFRTMVPGAERMRTEVEALNEAQPPLFKIRRDPRVTRLGRFLRASSLDELPQLLNVLVGQMSLVGPRPPLPHEVAAYTPLQARRLAVMPGLTGLWQVRGRSGCTFDEYVALDLEYVDNWSFWLDLRLVFSTFWAVLTSRGAY